MWKLSKKVDSRLNRGFRIPDEVAACEYALYEWTRRPNDFQPPELIDAMRVIERSGSLGNVFALTLLVLHPDDRVEKQCWRTIEKLMEKCGPNELPIISSTMRELWVNIGYSGNIHDAIPTTVLGLISFVRDGYARELAVKELASRFHAKELPYLILAANDWIKPVRSIAKEAVSRRINEEYKFCLLENIDLLVRLWKSQRESFDDLKKKFERVIVETTDKKFLHQVFKSGNSESRLYLYELLSSDPNESEDFISYVVLNGLLHWDTRVQTKAAELALARLSPEKIAIYFDRLAAHHLPLVRTETLRWAVAKKSFKHEEYLHSCLFDKSPRVRLLAHFLSKGKDLASIYTKNIQEKKFNLESTLRAMVEVKAKIPAADIETLLTHEKARVRAAAYALLFNNEPKDIRDLIFRALNDNAFLPAREAFLYICKDDSSILTPDELLEVAVSHPSLRTRRLSIKAISKLNVAKSGEYLLKAKELVPEEIRPIVDTFLKQQPKNFYR